MIRKIKNISLRCIYISIIIYLLVFIPSIWGYKPLVVISSSMEPNLKVGSILYYHKEDINNLKKNDILVYKLKNHIISHRIIENTKTGFITKGDANNTIDSSETLNNQVLGKGTNWCIPYVGFYADFIYNHKYLLYISVGILLLDLCYDSYNRYRKKEKESGVLCEKNN